MYINFYGSTQFTHMQAACAQNKSMGLHYDAWATLHLVTNAPSNKDSSMMNSGTQGDGAHACGVAAEVPIVRGLEDWLYIGIRVAPGRDRVSTPLWRWLCLEYYLWKSDCRIGGGSHGGSRGVAWRRTFHPGAWLLCVSWVFSDPACASSSIAICAMSSIIVLYLGDFISSRHRILHQYIHLARTM